MPVKISVSDTFDGGNIKFIRTQPNENNSSICDVVLHIKPDIYTELEKIGHMQYFSFRVSVSGLESGTTKTINYILENGSRLCPHW